MRVLFLDNFRGFKDTFIPIMDVNFLVGENSTGKSSVLGIINALSSDTFWLSGFKAAEQSNFDSFDDMVSARSPNRKYFSVGFISSSLKKKKSQNSDQDTTGAVLLTYVSSVGLPRLKYITISVANTRFVVCRTSNALYFKKNKMAASQLNAKNHKTTLKRWKHEHESKLTNAKKIPLPSNAPLALIIGYLLSTIAIKGAQIPKDGFGIGIPVFIPHTVWLAPVRSKPQRTYDEQTSAYSPEGQHIPYTIRNLLKKKSSREEIKNFIKLVGQQSGLFEGIATKEFGRGSMNPFELDVLIDGYPLSIHNVGYGVSQALPVFIESFIRSDGSCFLMQQPEVHLHPRAQAAMGEITAKLATQENKKFIIETHSDFIIDRFRIVKKRNRTMKNLQSQVLYFERYSRNNKVHSLPIDERGALPKSQPKGYRDFFIREQLKLLEY